MWRLCLAAGRRIVFRQLSKLLLFMLLAATGASRGAPLDAVRFTRITPAQMVPNAVAFGNDRFVVVSASGTVLTSVDAVRWDRPPLPVSTGWTGITWADGRFVVVGQGGTILTSTNATTWIRAAVASPAGASVSLQAVVGGGGQWVAAGASYDPTGTSAAVATSTNGLNWTVQSLRHGPSLSSITYGNGRFVATGGTNLFYSDDTLTWNYQLGSGSRVVFGNGVFVINSPLRTSADGVHWTFRPNPVFLGDFGFAGGEFIGFSHGQVYLSRDATLWTTVNQSDVPQPTKVSLAYGNGRFLAVTPSASSGSNFFISDDGFDWQVGPPGTITDSTRFLSYQRGRFLLASSVSPNLLWSSQDGLTWSSSSFSFEELRSLFQPTGAAEGNGLLVFTARQTLSTTFASSREGGDWRFSSVNLPLNDMVFGQERFVAVGDEGAVLTSTNAQIWVRGDSGTTNRLNAVEYGGGQFVAVGDRGTILSSSDGVDWFPQASPSTNALQSTAYGNNGFVAVGANGTIVTSANTLDWTVRATGTRAALANVAFGNEIFVAVGSAGTVLVSTNGLDWVRTNTGATGPFKVVAFGAGKFLMSGSTGLWEADLRGGALSAVTWDKEHFGFSVVGETGRVYAIQAADRLPGEWTEVGSVTMSHLAMPFVDTISSTGPLRFYRAVLHPETP